MTKPTLHHDAAAKLGVPVTEISDVEQSPAGLVIVTTDGVSYIDVPASKPDSDGKTGLMYLSAPVEKYTGSFPVYALPAEPDEARPAKQAAAAVTTVIEADRKALVARAKELGIALSGRIKNETIAQLIADAEAAAANAPQADDEQADDEQADDEQADDGQAENGQADDGQAENGQADDGQADDESDGDGDE